MKTAFSLIEEVKDCFKKHADPNNAQPMKRYMRDQFEFFGIKTPKRRELTKKWINDQAFLDFLLLKEFCSQCFEEEEREFQYLACDLLDKKVKSLDESAISFVEGLVLKKSWWDTVDGLASNVIGPLMLKYPKLKESYNKRWIESDNIWLQRTAILFQLTYKNKTDALLLFSNIRYHANSSEFFIQKGAGWALRNYSKAAPQAVVDFVQTETLPALTVREGLKWIKKINPSLLTK